MKLVINSVLILLATSLISGESTNLTCYQCTRNTNTECDPHELLPCPSVSDRCVTHISKNDENGFSIKRECGLGPCGFDDDMVNKGLGFGNCDRSREEYFCILCCRDSGCNKSGSTSVTSPNLLLLITFLFNLMKK
ncbi:hypothetical protein MTP99_016792 [Tenebrio molitor]|nr:hypothetical protein MTP99_016792 [Tenebrio molitor]CAH1375323.1 unnamed protein product [Tenebrio molitor]